VNLKQHSETRKKVDKEIKLMKRNNCINDKILITLNDGITEYFINVL
jgi:hypothetical protein